MKKVENLKNMGAYNYRAAFLDDLLTVVGPWVQLKGRFFASQECQRKIGAALSQWDAEATKTHMADKNFKREIEGMIVEGEALEDML